MKEKKVKDSIRITSFNVNGTGKDKLSQISEQDIKDFRLVYEVDVFGMTETELN